MLVAVAPRWTISNGSGWTRLAGRRSLRALFVGHAGGERQDDQHASREQRAGGDAAGASYHDPILTAVLDARAGRLAPELFSRSGDNAVLSGNGRDVRL